MGRSETLTHLHSVDDVLLYYFGSKNDGSSFKNIVQLYNETTHMEVNVNKSTLYTYEEFSPLNIWI